MATLLDARFAISGRGGTAGDLLRVRLFRRCSGSDSDSTPLELSLNTIISCDGGGGELDILEGRFTRAMFIKVPLARLWGRGDVDEGARFLARGLLLSVREVLRDPVPGCERRGDDWLLNFRA